ncbi:MAG TPA: YggS family pyridoxal phosphate-dependent enzyme [Candidatus Limnocylindrales bacterium]|nr:YggS family pyridoxal phosphate-dependent enzyme [Candidatus Limnocylindrales bacterium]
MTDDLTIDTLREARDRVITNIQAACARVGRDPGEVTLVAVSKTVGVERLRAAVEAGLGVLGENRVQEAAGKVGLVDGATWHLVGPLQSNKARRAVELFDVVESVDSVDLARRLDRLAGEMRPDRRLPILLQVNVDADAAKAGFSAHALEAALAELTDLAHLRLDGLMTIGRLVGSAEEARPTFRALRDLSARLRDRHAALGAGLSMGMTDDYAVAVEEGATIVRVGRAIFGERPHAHGPAGLHTHAHDGDHAHDHRG